MLLFYDDSNSKANAKAKIKKFGASRIVLFFNFNEDKNEGTLVVRMFRREKSQDVEGEFKLNFKTKYLDRGIKRIVVSELVPNDITLDLLLSDNVIECYPRNLDNISINNSHTIYWLDTLIISNGKRTKQIKYNQISFPDVQMIYYH